VEDIGFQAINIYYYKGSNEFEPGLGIILEDGPIGPCLGEVVLRIDVVHTLISWKDVYFEVLRVILLAFFLTGLIYATA